MKPVIETSGGERSVPINSPLGGIN